jgi:small redox-active disulfide protein 2
MDIKVLGAGCASCKSMFADVQRLVTQLNLNARVEYVTDMEKIMSYGVMSTPVLIIDEQVVMVGHHSARKIEQALRKGSIT